MEVSAQGINRITRDLRQLSKLPVTPEDVLKVLTEVLAREAAKERRDGQ